jgi:hypothetical protein
MFGGGWLGGIRGGSGYRQGNHAGKNGQTVRKQSSHTENTSISEIWFSKNRPKRAAEEIQGEGAGARISGVRLLQA